MAHKLQANAKYENPGTDSVHWENKRTSVPMAFEEGLSGISDYKERKKVYNERLEELSGEVVSFSFKPHMLALDGVISRMDGKPFVEEEAFFSAFVDFLERQGLCYAGGMNLVDEEGFQFHERRREAEKRVD